MTPGTAVVPYKEPARITEREVRMAGQVSNRLCALRGFLAQGVANKGGSLTVQTTNGSQSLALIREETEALIALMIERDEAMLIGLNVEIEK